MTPKSAEPISTRPVVESDYDWLYRLRREGYLDVVKRQFGSWDEDLQQRLFEEAWNPAASRIVVLDGKPVGMLTSEERQGNLWLDEIQVLREHQGQGLGSRLIAQILSQARDQGLPVRLQVLHENTRAKSLYERFGFREIERKEHYFVMEAP